MKIAGNNQKLKILYLMKILLEKTDETHSITMSEILESLEAYGVSAERKSIYNDIQNLCSYGLDIICAFDNDINKTDCIFNNKYIYSLSDLERITVESNVHIAILTVPQKCAQEMCNRLVAIGIRGIWNFTSAVLEVPEGVIIQNENMASSLAILSNKLKELLY